MKIVFNFKTAARLAAVSAALFASLALPSSARAEGVYFSTRDLLADFFRTSKNVTYKKIDLTDELKQRLVKRLGYSPARRSYTFFVATTDKCVDGYALVDDEQGEHLPITFAVKLSPNGVVERQEIIAYREPRGDEVRDARFRQQFVGKSAQDPIAANLDIVAVSGATISSRAMAVGVKRAVVLFDELLRKPTAEATTAAASLAGRPGCL